MRALLAVLLLLPAAQALPLDIDIAQTEWSYGPESWKASQPGNVDDQASFAVQSADWSASLGARLNVTVLVTRDGGPPGSDWDFEAVLSDGLSTLSGLVEAQTPGRLHISFDVDGQRALPGLPAIAALVPGTWTLRLDATSPDGAADRPEGWGTAQFDTRRTAFDGIVAGTPVLGVGVPEDTLPGFREVGAGPNAWMPAEPLDPGVAHDLWVRAPAGEQVRWTAWTLTALPAAPDPLLGTPFQPYMPRSGQTGLGWTRVDLDTSTAGPDGRAGLRVPAGVIPAQVGVERGLWAIGAASESGVTSFMYAFATDAPRIQSISTGEPGNAAPVQFTLTHPAGDVPLAGPAFVFLHDKEADPLREANGRIVTTATMARTAAETWQGGYDGAATRSQMSPGTTLVAFLQESRTVCDAPPATPCIPDSPDDPGVEYLGHASAMRALDIELDVPLLGAGTQSDVHVIVRNPTSLPIAARIGFALGDTATAIADVDVLPGGELRRVWPVTPAQSGAVRVTAVVDTGDLLWEERETVTVLTKDAYLEETSPWYGSDRLTPSPVAMPLAALLAALVLTRRSSQA